MSILSQHQVVQAFIMSLLQEQIFYNYKDDPGQPFTSHSNQIGMVKQTVNNGCSYGHSHTSTGIDMKDIS